MSDVTGTIHRIEPARRRVGDRFVRSDFRWLTVGILGVAVMALAGGCAMIKVETDPPGARVEYSYNGLAPWQPWRGGQGKDLAPSRNIVWCGTSCFVRAEKEGYRPTPPKLIEAFMFDWETVRFDLVASPELEAMERRAQGLVLFEGQWVDPGQQGLVERDGKWMTPEENYTLEQQAAGLISFDGRWMTPAERESLFAEQQRAKGMTFYQGRWMKAADREKRIQIEEAIDTAMALQPMALPVKEAMPVPRAGVTELKLYNGTRSPIHAYFAGPVAFETYVDPLGSASRTIPPGHYRIAMVPVLPEQPAQAGEMTFEDYADVGKGVVFSLSYTGDPGKLLRDLKAQPVVDLELPEIVIPEIELPPELAGDEDVGPPSEEDLEKAREIMQRVMAGELTREEAFKLLPKSVQRQRLKRQGEVSDEDRRGPGRGRGGGGSGGGRGGGR
jgi:hypothetical protein